MANEEDDPVVQEVTAAPALCRAAGSGTGSLPSSGRPGACCCPSPSPGTPPSPGACLAEPRSLQVSDPASWSEASLTSRWSRGLPRAHALAPRLGLASPGHGRQSPSTKVQAWRKQRLRPGRLVCKAKASAWRDNSYSVTLLGERMGLTTPPSSDSVARSCSLGPPGLWQRCRGGEEVFLPLGSVGLWGGTGRQWGGSFQPPRSGPLRGLWAFAPFTRASSPVPGVDGPSLVQRPGG